MDKAPGPLQTDLKAATKESALITNQIPRSALGLAFKDKRTHDLLAGLQTHLLCHVFMAKEGQTQSYGQLQNSGCIADFTLDRSF